MADGTLEECIDRLDEFAQTLNGFPEPVLALAMRVHLTALLRALLESQSLTAAQAQDYLSELSRDVFAR